MVPTALRSFPLVVVPMAVRSFLLVGVLVMVVRNFPAEGKGHRDTALQREGQDLNNCRCYPLTYTFPNFRSDHQKTFQTCFYSIHQEVVAVADIPYLTPD